MMLFSKYIPLITHVKLGITPLQLATTCVTGLSNCCYTVKALQLLVDARCATCVPVVPAGGDLGGEYARQRNYLEKTIESLKRKLAADSEAHRADELKIMSQNVTLIRELNELRREIKVQTNITGVTGCSHETSV